MIRFDRRSFIITSAFGIGGLALPDGRLAAQMLGAARGFTHNVASGEPGPQSVLLWTRYVGEGASAHVRAEIAEDEAFARIVARDTVITGPWRDWTAKVTLDGLVPGKRYFYRFAGPDGSFSPVGRTKTLPVGRVARFGIGVFSCSNLPAGVFNAYAHAAARDDIDVALHLGDYFYEYQRGGYPAASPRWDLILPVTETVSLADYRLRFASYRADKDLQAIHNRHPMIVSMDDHESTNDAWEGSAQNHQPEEGDWNTRRAAAIQAYREWMPIDDLPYKSYQIGDLATFFRTETRLLARTTPPSVQPLFAAPDVPAALAKFKNETWRDPAMTMMGTTQERWLYEGLRQSTRARTRWQVVGTGTIMGETYTPPAAAQWLSADAPDWARRRALGGIALTQAGLPFNFDNWGGYPAARARLLSAAQSANANLIMLAGDSHNAWAYDLANNGRAAGVEFAGHSVTSPGFEASTRGTDPAAVAAAIIKSSPELRWADTSRRGYMALTLTPRAATNEWVFMQAIDAPNLATQPAHRMQVRPGMAKLEAVT
ncbi:MAG: alkaline phosphatase D family protein [Sphingomonadaceae bacterium]